MISSAIVLLRQAFPFIICGVIFLLYHLWQQSQQELENAKTIAKFEDSRFAISKQLLQEQLENKWNDSILKENGYKPKNVQAVTNIHYHKTEVVYDTSVIKTTDTSVCIDYNHKGFKLSGCNGVYTDEREFEATGFVINQPTKKFLFIKYRKEPILRAWTKYGDSLKISLVTKPN